MRCESQRRIDGSKGCDVRFSYSSLVERKVGPDLKKGAKLDRGEMVERRVDGHSSPERVRRRRRRIGEVDIAVPVSLQVNQQRRA